MTQQYMHKEAFGLNAVLAKTGRKEPTRRRSRPANVTIAGAAIRYSDIGVRALPLPASHDDIRDLVAQLHGCRAGKHKGEVGYITNRGGFVKNKEALVIARHAGQLGQAPIRTDELCLEYLHREDVRAPAPSGAIPQRRPGGSGPPLRWGRSRRAAGELVCTQDLRRERARNSSWIVGLLLLTWVFSNGLSQLSAGLEGAYWPRLGAQAALYLVLGLAVANVIDARGVGLRKWAIGAFAMLVALSLLWPLALSAGMQVPMLGATFMVAAVTFTLFARIRVAAALLLAPAAAWILIAGYAAHDPAQLAHPALALFS